VSGFATDPASFEESDVPRPWLRNVFIRGLKKPFFYTIFKNVYFTLAVSAFQRDANSDARKPQKPASEVPRHLQENPDMKKTISAFLAVATIAGAMAATPASAQRGLGAGLAAGLIGGAIVGGAIASSRPGYAAPAPVYVDEEPAPCRMVRERFWDGYGWRFRRVEVCN
jgi:hypothetical protein